MESCLPGRHWTRRRTHLSSLRAATRRILRPLRGCRPTRACISSRPIAQTKARLRTSLPPSERSTASLMASSTLPASFRMRPWRARRLTSFLPSLRRKSQAPLLWTARSVQIRSISSFFFPRFPAWSAMRGRPTMPPQTASSTPLRRHARPGAGTASAMDGRYRLPGRYGVAGACRLRLRKKTSCAGPPGWPPSGRGPHLMLSTPCLKDLRPGF